jgi:iron complex outermembrane receptor protein
MKPKNHPVFLILIALCLSFVTVQPLLAQEQSTAPEPGVFHLGEVVVTGAGELVTQVTTVDTVSREQMDLTNAKDVSQALETLPGVSVSKGARNEAYINVRGFNQRYVPIFYDGIPLYIPNDGYTDPSQLLTGNLSQITLTKGAASVLYGPNTMGGVINIITMKPQQPLTGSYNTEVDENGVSGSLNLGSKLDRFYVMLGAAGLSSDGFKMSDDFTPIRTPAGFRGYYENGGTRDNSDADSASGNFKAGFMPAPGHEYAFGIQTVESSRGLPPNVYYNNNQRFWRFSEWEKTTYYFIGDTRWTDDLWSNVRLYYDSYYNVLDAYDDATYTTQTRRSSFHSTYDDYTPGGSLVLRTTYIPNNTLSFAFHYKDDVHEEQDNYNLPWEHYEAETFSYGLEDSIRITDNLGLVLGVSYDLQKPLDANGGALRDDDDAWNGLGGLVYTFKDDTKVHGSIAAKSRFPTLKELYSSYLGTAIPNPNLMKEEAVNSEVGVERPLPWKSAGGLTFFYSDVKNLITRTTVGGRDSYTNIGEARYQGLEFTFTTEIIPGNILAAHYTYLNAEDKSENRTSDHLREAPENQIYISDLFKVNDVISLFGRLQYNQGQWDQTSSLYWVRLGGYWLADVKLIAEIYKSLIAEAGVRNLLDYNYETAYGFPREGRTFFIALRGVF